MNIYRDGNVFCPFCGQEAAGYKVCNNAPGEDGQWWHRCYSKGGVGHVLEIKYPGGLVELHELGEMIYLSEDGTLVEGNGHTYVYDNDPVDINVSPPGVLSLDLGSIDDHEKNPNLVKSEHDIEMLNRKTGKMENVHVTSYEDKK